MCLSDTTVCPRDHTEDVVDQGVLLPNYDLKKAQYHQSGC